jgi:hypothetical protein
MSNKKNKAFLSMFYIGRLLFCRLHANPLALLAQKPNLENFSKQILSSFSLVRIQFYMSWASGKWVSVKSAE